MAIEYERKTAANGNISIGADPSGTAFSPYISAANNYAVFFRMKEGTFGYANCQILVSGVGRVQTNGYGGLYLVEVLTANGKFSTVRTTTIVPSNLSVTFGWYREGDYVYIGVLRTTNYSASLTATLLGYDPENAREWRIGNFYAGTTAPTGWTAISSRTVLPTGGAATGVSSLAAIKTQLSAWYSSQGTSSIGCYTLGLQGTISPFATSANLVVEIRASSTANYATAILTAHNTNGGSMYLMSLNNGTWTDPKTVTLT